MRLEVEYELLLTNRLLGGKVVAFDMRAPDRIYMRIPDRAKREALRVAGAAARKKEEKED